MGIALLNFEPELGFVSFLLQEFKSHHALVLKRLESPNVGRSKCLLKYLVHD